MNRDMVPERRRLEAGFTIAEFLISSLILLVISAALYDAAARMQRVSSFQDEIQGVLESARYALENITRVVSQAGNDPRGIGFAPLVITSPTEIRVRSDLTGSAGATFPDKGDPDGDIEDSGEDVTIRYSASSRAVELASGSGSAQAVANGITAFRMDFFDRNGAPTTVADQAFRLRVTITATSSRPDPQTRAPFSIELSREALLPMRK